MTIIKKFDVALAGVIAHVPRKLSQPFKILGVLTSPLAWVTTLTITAVLLPAIDFRAYVIMLVFTPFAGLIKFAFRRQRPPTIYAGEMRIKSYSFPSSHSYASALCCAFFASLALQAGLAVLALLLGFLAVTVGVSRIFLGAHYPSDVVAGLAMGLLIGASISLWL